MAKVRFVHRDRTTGTYRPTFIWSNEEELLSHTNGRTGITDMYLSHKYTIFHMMQVSGHNHEVLAEDRAETTNVRQQQKTFMDYLNLSSDEKVDEMKLADKLEAQVWL